MAISRERRVEPIYWVLLLAACLAVPAVPFWTRVHAHREEQRIAAMQAIARQVPSPAIVNHLVIHHDCNGQDIVRCQWTPDLNVDELARAAQASLSRLSQHEVELRCENVRSLLLGRPRACSVNLNDNGHGVSIDLYPYEAVLPDEQGNPSHAAPSLLGTRYTMQTF